METPIVSSASLESGLAALEQGQYQAAIGSLEAFCHDYAVSDQTASRDYLRAQMHLIKIYEQIGQTKRAEILCHQLAVCANAQVQIWAQQRLKAMHDALPVETDSITTEPIATGSVVAECAACKLGASSSSQSLFTRIRYSLRSLAQRN